MSKFKTISLFLQFWSIVINTTGVYLIVIYKKHYVKNQYDTI